MDMGVSLIFLGLGWAGLWSLGRLTARAARGGKSARRNP